MQEKYSGIIIRENDVGESDRIITILSSDFGLLRAFARGSKKIKGRLFSATRMFTYADFVLYSGRDKYIVTEAQRISGFFTGSGDIERLAVAQYICELCCSAIPQEQPDETGDLLRLVLNTLYALDKTDKPVELIKASFELRMMALLGYCPDVSSCAQCGKDGGDMCFFPSDGQLLCAECARSGIGGERLDPAAVSAARYVLTCENGKLFSYTIPENSRRLLGLASEKYVTTQLERHFKTLDFYHSL